MILKIGSAFAIVSLQLFYNTHASDPCVSVEPTPAQESHVIDTIHELGRKISYAQYDKSPPPSNVVLSSLSIAIILNLLLIGTKGSTSTEIREALNYENGLNECVINKIYQKLISSLEGASGSEIEISLNTKLFPQERFPIFSNYTYISNTYYFSEVQNLDYENSAAAATKTINEWVSDNTNGKIPELFKKDLSSDTILVIVNVIFFNATWENKFDPAFTFNGTFEAENGNIDIPMMTREMTIPYLNDSIEGFQIISLPYVGNRFSMYILKPTGDNSVIRLKEIENSTTSAELNNIIDRMEPELVSVTILKMKLELGLQLQGDLNDLGISQIFNNGADFGGMTDVPNLVVSEIVHKAILEVAENGTVAAAATGVGIIKISASDAKIFTQDKPSLLFIRDNKNKVIIFTATVLNPEPIW